MRVNLAEKSCEEVPKRDVDGIQIPLKHHCKSIFWDHVITAATGSVYSVDLQTQQ